MKKLVFAIAFYAICSPVNAQQNTENNLRLKGGQEKVNINRNHITPGFYMIKLVGLNGDRHLRVIIK